MIEVRSSARALVAGALRDFLVDGLYRMRKLCVVRQKALGGVISLDTLGLLELERLRLKGTELKWLDGAVRPL